ncbi:methyltransferase domain-containing protein [Pseudonocardia sp. C8]|uniref:protein-L-isoaspartate O-methyltransferase family protein n=1 Tax=Pseudonocardia sp. C8 TaxID=2762759 RepID=UPI0016423C82|nr:methyltransferase domain-containing protein [Pseudonocardia sp. C8]MBC3189926.1 methyltransferase domain-containing protein [Pseudonocardia sp. C8]
MRVQADLVADLRRQGITDERVLAAVAEVPRHLFVAPGDEERAYHDIALPIGRGQTISSPWIVARSIAALGPLTDGRVLEIGTGSGYAAAVLARCVGQVVTVERDAELARRAGTILSEIAPTVDVRTGDGLELAGELGPFDGIVVTALAQSRLPTELVGALTPDGVLVCPVGDDRVGTLVRYQHGESVGLAEVTFVPLVRGTRD